MSKTILVTGGAGFIGSHLVDCLVDRGENVVVVDNFNRFYSPQQKERNLTKSQGRSNFFLHRADIRNNNAMKTVFSKYRFDCVVHLAAMAGVRPSIERPQLYADVNVSGTLNLLERMKEYGVKRLMFGSSSSVYGNRSQGPFKEIDVTDKPISPYGATKKAGELLCCTYAHLYSIKTTILRFFTVFGPRNRPDMACFKFIDAMMKGLPIMRFGKGDTGRDYTYVDDIIDGVLAAIEKPLNYEVINIGNSAPVKLNGLIRTLEKITGKKAKINELPLQPGDVSLTFADISKAKKLLSYTPKVKFREGMALLFSWYMTTYAQ